MDTPLENEIAKRFGVLPNFFRLASADPKIAANLWGFAQFAYLDNPLPSLFKERLFVYLSRFCEVRYCIARHLGFLVGLGYPAGDSACRPPTLESVLPLLRRPLPRGGGLLPLFAIYSEAEGPLSSFPEPDSLGEQALFACATHVFLQTPDASRAHEVLGRVLGARNLEQLNLLLAFVRTAHYWTKLHPELSFEDDIVQLLATHEQLATCILNDTEARRDSLSHQVAEELASLRKLRQQHESMAQAYQELAVNHQYAKHSLLESEENLHEVVSAMPASVYACDRDGIITYYNDKALDIWGCAPQLDDAAWSFLDSRRIFRVDGTPLRPEEFPVKEVLAKGVPIVNCEMVLQRPDSSRINVLANIAPLRDSGGTVRGAVSIFQDITELKRIQQEREALLHELERSNQELSQFSFAVSHDLQAPVRNVRALTQLLVRRDDRGQEDASHLLSLVEQATAGMERLIESLLRYAQAGQGTLKRKRVAVQPIIDSLRVTLTPLIEKTGAQIVCRPLPQVDADPVMLEQLLQNLIANAIKYHRPEESPLVEISGRESGEGWHFAVKDNGQGIPQELQARVFEPLKRLHGAEIPGTGLGLTLCRAVVARHGGRLWVESEGSGRGAIFHFTLPMSQPSPSIVWNSPVA
jgi:signal transduction histidine kinase